MVAWRSSASRLRRHPGRIVELPVQEGDLVKAGDLIARQDSTELAAQKAAVAAAMERAQQAIARAKAETQVRQVQVRLAQLELDHTEKLRRDTPGVPCRGGTP